MWKEILQIRSQLLYLYVSLYSIQEIYQPYIAIAPLGAKQTTVNVQKEVLLAIQDAIKAALSQPLNSPALSDDVHNSIGSGSRVGLGWGLARGC